MLQDPIPDLPSDLSLMVGDETAFAASEFQEAVREELLEAANNILEKCSGLDDFDLCLCDCTVTTNAAGRYIKASLKIGFQGRRVHLKRVNWGHTGTLAQRLITRANVRFPRERPKRKRVGGRWRVTKPADPKVAATRGLHVALRAVKGLLALRDAVVRYPAIGEADTLLRLLSTYRKLLQKTPRRQALTTVRRFLRRFGEAAGLGGARGAVAAYGPLLPRERTAAALAGLSYWTLREMEKTLVKLRAKIKEEAEKNGLLGGFGDLGGMPPADLAAETGFDLAPAPPRDHALAAGYDLEDEEQL